MPMNLWWPFEHVLRVSFQASVLVLLVLLVQAFFRRRLSARWRHALWSLVIIRLLLPVSVESPFSLFSLARHGEQGSSLLESLGSRPKHLEAFTVESGMLRERNKAVPVSVGREQRPSQPAVSVPMPTRDVATPERILPWKWILPILWLTAAAVMMLLGLGKNIRFWLRVKRARPVEAPSVINLLHECRRMMSVNARVTLVETGAVTGPALYGVFRSRLLLPPGTVDDLTTAELRHVFLHELAHVRRKDMLVHLLISLLRILHWFNPLVWLASRRIAADRELACDELVLSVAGAEQSGEYGRTIIKLMERAFGGRVSTAVVGILEDQKHLERRMTMIADFNPDRKGTMIAMALILLLGSLTLTDGQSAAGSEAIPVEVALTQPSPTPRTAEEAVAWLASFGAQTISRDEQRPGRPVKEVLIGPLDPSRGQKQTWSFANSTPYRHYRFTVQRVQDDYSESAPPESLRLRRCMQVREVELLDARQRDVTRPGDPIIASSTNSPAGEEVVHVIDDSDTKYLNFDTASGVSAGFTVSPSIGTTLITGLSITSADDFPSRDPRIVTLEGSNDERVSAWEGGNWTTITKLEIIPWAKLWPQSAVKVTANQLWDVLALLPELQSLGVPGALVDDEAMARLSKFPRLEQLRIPDRTWVTDAGMAHVAQLPSLGFFLMADTAEVTDQGVSYLANQTNLWGLVLISTRLSGYSGITDESCRHLENLSRLSTLTLMGTKITDAGLTHFKGLTNLTFVNLGANPQITGSGLAHFRGMKNLRQLYIADTGLADEGLRHVAELPALRVLLCGGTYVTDEGLAYLRGLSKLEVLDLGSNAGGPQLSLGGTRVGNGGLAHLQGLKRLQALLLDRTQVTDDGLRLLQPLTQLRVLRLAHTRVSDASTAHLSALTNLTFLSLAETGVTDAGLGNLKDLNRLQGLELNGTSISDRGLEQLAGMEGLRQLGVKDTQVTSEGTRELKRRLPEIWIEF